MSKRTEKPIRCWWFEPADGVLGYDDGRKPKKGRVHRTKAAPRLCYAGMHGSVRLIDALRYAKGANVWIVEIGGNLQKGEDKVCGTYRKYIQRVNIEDILFEFSRKCALSVVDKWEAPKVVIDYLKSGDASLRSAARSAAESAAESTTWLVARSAARSATWAATWAATESVAWLAARSATESVARLAAESVVWLALNKKLTAAVMKKVRIGAKAKRAKK